MNPVKNLPNGGYFFCDADAIDLVESRVWFLHPEKVATLINGDHVDVFVVMNATVNKDNPYLYLANSKTNVDKFYLQFELYADGSDTYFYQSDLVEAKADEDVVLPVDVYSKLDKGSHKVKVLTKA